MCCPRFPAQLCQHSASQPCPAITLLSQSLGRDFCNFSHDLISCIDFSIACLTKAQPVFTSLHGVRLSSGIISIFQMQREAPAQAPGSPQKPGQNWEEVGSGCRQRCRREDPGTVSECMKVDLELPVPQLHESHGGESQHSQTLTSRRRGSSLGWSIFKSYGLEMSERSVLCRGNIWQHQLSAAVTPAEQ